MMLYLLYTVLLLKNINGVISFNTQEYALTHPCHWSTCESLPAEHMNYTITCCILQVPLNYAKPNQSSISISMIRLSPSNITSNNSLFVLSGGPGEAALNLLVIVAQLVPAEYGVTLIAPDHRGTGFSTPLGCDNQNSQTITADCITYLKNRWTIEGLNQFTTTSAAHDLAIQIQATQSVGQISFLGVSYGSYWLNRFLTIYPNLVVHTAVMDSPVNPLLHAFSLYNIRASAMATQYLTYCHYQIACIKHFPTSSPVMMLHQILQEIDANQQKCINTYLTKYNLTSTSIKMVFFKLFQFTTTDGTVLPAIIFRLNRCNEEDLIALNFFFKTQSSSTVSSKQLLSKATEPFVAFSTVLYNNIGFSELWLYLNQSDVDQQMLNIWQNSTLISPDLRSDLVATVQEWPKYPLDEYRYRLANSSILMMNGQLDSATSLDFAVHLVSMTSKTRKLYSIPLSGHVILTYVMTSGYTCPLHLFLSWAFPTVFPNEWNNPLCLQDLPITIDFAGETTTGQINSLKLFNTTLPFGNTNISTINNQAVSHHSSASFIFILSSFMYLIPINF